MRCCVRRRQTGHRRIPEETSPGRWQVSVPIMALNARLGTVAIDCTTQPPCRKPVHERGGTQFHWCWECLFLSL